MLADFLRIKIYLPCEGEVSDICEATFPERLSQGGFLSELIAKLKRHDLIGHLGNYEAVYEIGPGLEGYTPCEKAVPTSGSAHVPSRVQNIAFITYAPVNAGEEVDRFVEEISALHPWEYPVIEVAPIRMWTP